MGIFQVALTSLLSHHHFHLISGDEKMRMTLILSSSSYPLLPRICQKAIFSIILGESEKRGIEQRKRARDKERRRKRRERGRCSEREREREQKKLLFSISTDDRRLNKRLVPPTRRSSNGCPLGIDRAERDRHKCSAVISTPKAEFGTCNADDENTIEE